MCVRTCTGKVCLSLLLLTQLVLNPSRYSPARVLPFTLSNGTDLVGNANVPDTLLCVTQSASNAANWYVDSNPNRSSGQSPALVTTASSLLPHVVSPRAGRSNLVLNGTIGDAQQGYFSCVTNPSIVLGIFSQTPVAPTADISPNQASIQVVIGTNTPSIELYYFKCTPSCSDILLDRVCQLIFCCSRY